MQAAWRRVASSDVPLLIEGETGVGKEVLARQIHAHSPRAHKPFLKLNCAALPGELIESELFGYERGAFTGAFASKPGKFELAQGGTILLEREVERLGSSRTISLDVRLIATSNRDIPEEVRAGRFRADLYYRLNVVSIRVPALRERKADIPAAAEFFLRKHRSGASPVSLLSPDLRHAMLAYDWPGNLRELENMMRRLLVIQDPDEMARQLQSAGVRRAATAIGRRRKPSCGRWMPVAGTVNRRPRSSRSTTRRCCTRCASWISTNREWLCAARPAERRCGVHFS